MKPFAMLLPVLLMCHHALAQAMPDLVVLVRHAEKSGEPADDPALSTAGQQRAQALAQALADAGVTAIITTQYRRTRDTAQPLAIHMKIEPQVVTARRGESAQHVAEVTAAIRQHSGTVLVVGHSNTVTDIATALGGPAMANFCDTTFGLALVLHPQAKGAALLRLRYGEADAPPQPGCL